MNKGEMVLLKQGRRRIQCEVIREYDEYPAVRIYKGGEEWIVGRHDLVSAEELKAEAEEKMRKEVETVRSVIDAFKAGHKTIRGIAEYLKLQMIDVVSKCRKAERLGQIKLERTTNESRKKKSRKGQQES